MVIPGPQPQTAHPWGDAATPYEELGGDPAVRTLVDTFYDIIDTESPKLRAMLPTNDAGSRTKLYEFLSGWMGGPPLYIEKRGHPRLRMRHLPFPIGTYEIDEWLRCMGKALDNCEVDGPLRPFLEAQFFQSAHWMRNQEG